MNVCQCVLQLIIDNYITLHGSTRSLNIENQKTLEQLCSLTQFRYGVNELYN